MEMVERVEHREQRGIILKTARKEQQRGFKKNYTNGTKKEKKTGN